VQSAVDEVCLSVLRLKEVFNRKEPGSAWIDDRNTQETGMAGNRAVAYIGPRKLEIQNLDYPKLVDPRGKKCEHGVILKLVVTNICGSDQHIYRGRFPAPSGMILGHENTGEVVEVGRDVEFIKKGDLVSVPFNVSCGKCRNCRERHTEICMNANPDFPCAAYGFNLGGWQGGQA
jgi:glutathione-independent formaldehyde dehydrogenase